MRKTMEIIWRGFIFGTKLDVYNSGVPSSINFFPVLRFVVLFFDLTYGYFMILCPQWSFLFLISLLFLLFIFWFRFGGAEVECFAENICGKKIPRSSEGELMIVSLSIWDVPWMENLICIHGTDWGIAVASNNYCWQRPGNAFNLLNSRPP